METNAAKVIKRLKEEGWAFDRHGAAHDIYRHPEKAEAPSTQSRRGGFHCEEGRVEHLTFPSRKTNVQRPMEL
jgi:predicted RNA binding protein YcfA (HicA-like mRNA interferase family)